MALLWAIWSQLASGCGHIKHLDVAISHVGHLTEGSLCLERARPVRSDKLVLLLGPVKDKEGVRSAGEDRPVVELHDAWRAPKRIKETKSSKALAREVSFCKVEEKKTKSKAKLNHASYMLPRTESGRGATPGKVYLY